MILEGAYAKSTKWLQWGRTQLSAEITVSLPVLREQTPLQWGRTQLSAEMHGTPDRRYRDSRASMGPHSTECGNIRYDWWRSVGRVHASMGPHSTECGN